jgi:TRAP-type C4-dicarboxylate transport system substrate-binding protein
MHIDRTIHYGSLWPEGHFGRSVAEGFAKAIAEGTNSRIQIRVTPPLSDEDLTKNVIEGKIEMTSGHAIQNYVPELGLGYLPYLYKSYDEFRHIWTLGTPISDAILAKFKDRNIPVLALGYSVIGFRDMILRNRHIVEAEDFKGLIVRNDGSTSTHDMFKAFGAKPQVIEYHKVKKALADGVVEAAANTSFNLIYMEWYKVANNVSLTSHQILTNLEIVNIDFWNSLTPSDQELFCSAIRDACDNFATLAKRKRGEAINLLADEYGLSVNDVSDVTKTQLAAEVESMKMAFVKQYGLEKEYEEILSSLAMFRSVKE